MGWVLPETAQEICWLPPPPTVVSSGLRWMVDADQTQHLAPLPVLGPVATAARWLVQVQGRGLQAKWLVQVQGRDCKPSGCLGKLRFSLLSFCPKTWEELRSAFLGADWLHCDCYCHFLCFQVEVYGFRLYLKGACSWVVL